MNTHPRWKDLAIYSGAMLVCCGLAFVLLELWRADLRIPFVYGGGDELPICMWIKGVKDNPWIFHNSRIGMPFGLELFSYPLPESFHLLVFKVLGFTTRHFGKILNLVYLATFPAVLLSSLYVCRRLGLSYPAAIFSSFLYTFLPFHFRRGEAHLFLSAYYTVPLILLVIFRLFSAQALFFGGDQDEAKGFRDRLRRTWGIILICALLGSTGIGYYAFFACLLLGVAGVAAAIYRRRIAPLLNATVVAFLIVITVAVNIAPNLLYGRRATALRPAADAEIYGLKIAQLLLPIGGHRLPLFAEAKERYNNAPLVNENDSAALGLVGGAGFLFLFGWIGFRLMRSDVRGFNRGERELLDCSALLVLTATLLGTIGGFGSLFAFLIQPQFRSYNRISVYIAFLCFLAIGVLIDRVMRSQVRTSVGKVVTTGILLFLLICGILDQTTRQLIPDYRAAKESFEEDERFVHGIEAVAPAGAMIFQLPYIQFPESGGVNKMLNYDPARGYLHATKLRWSYGAMKDEAGDAWQRAVSSMPIEEMAQALVFAGFSGIYLDRFGYADNGVQLQQEFAQVLGEGPLVASARLLFFSLEHYKATLRTKLSDKEWRDYQDRLNPPFVVYESGFYPEESSPGRIWRWSRGESSLRFFNLSSRPKSLVLEARIASGYAESYSLQIISPILNKVLKINRSGIHLRETIVLPVGESEVNFRCDAPRVNAPGDPRFMVFGVENLTIREIRATTTAR